MNGKIDFDEEHNNNVVNHSIPIRKNRKNSAKGWEYAEEVSQEYLNVKLSDVKRDGGFQRAFVNQCNSSL